MQSRHLSSSRAACLARRTLIALFLPVLLLALMPALSVTGLAVASELDRAELSKRFPEPYYVGERDTAGVLRCGASLDERVLGERQPFLDGLWPVVRQYDGVRHPLADDALELAHLVRVVAREHELQGHAPAASAPAKK